MKITFEKVVANENDVAGLVEEFKNVVENNLISDAKIKVDVTIKPKA